MRSTHQANQRLQQAIHKASACALLIKGRRHEILCQNLVLLGISSYLAENFSYAHRTFLGISLTKQMHQRADIQPELLCFFALCT